MTLCGGVSDREWVPEISECVSEFLRVWLLLQIFSWRHHREAIGVPMRVEVLVHFIERVIQLNTGRN